MSTEIFLNVCVAEGANSDPKSPTCGCLYFLLRYWNSGKILNIRVEISKCELKTIHEKIHDHWLFRNLAKWFFTDVSDVFEIPVGQCCLSFSIWIFTLRFISSGISLFSFGSCCRIPTVFPVLAVFKLFLLEVEPRRGNCKFSPPPLSLSSSESPASHCSRYRILRIFLDDNVSRYAANCLKIQSIRVQHRCSSLRWNSEGR